MANGRNNQEQRRFSREYKRDRNRDYTHAQTGLDAPNFRRDNWAWYDPTYYEGQGRYQGERMTYDRQSGFQLQPVREPRQRYSGQQTGVQRGRPRGQQSANEQYEYGREYDWDDRYNTNWGYNNWVQGPYAGIGPSGYRRADTRIWEDVNERLAEHPHLNASMMDVQVEDGIVTLNGTVPDRRQKRIAEDLAESVSGVTDVQNNLRIQQNQP